MASKKKSAAATPKVCRIFQWIEQQDERFASAIRSLCMEGALSKGATGTTFLYPKDKAYRDEIADAAEGADADEAVDMIKSLIIHEGLPNASDFQRGPIGSGGGVLYEVEDVSGDTIRLKGGVTLKKEEGFRLLRHKEEGTRRLVVWNITEGRPPLTGPAYVRPRRGATKGANGHPGADGKTGGAAAATFRGRLAAKAERDFDTQMKLDGCRTRDPYLALVVSLLQFLKMQHPDILQAVLPLIDYNPVVAFYILLEPHKTAGAHMIPDAILSGTGGWNGAESFSDAVGEYKQFFDELADGAASASASTAASHGSSSSSSSGKGKGGRNNTPYIYRDHAAIVRATDLIRQKIADVTDKMSLTKIIVGAYGQLAASNSIGDLGPIFPAATLALLGGGKKAWQDEFRFVIHAATQELYSAARAATGNVYDPAEWGAVVSTLQIDRPGNDYVKEATLVGMVAMKGNVNPTVDFHMLKKFGNSTDFLYVPAPAGMIGGFMGDGGDPFDMQVYNRNYDAHRTLERGRTRGGGVSAQALTELRMYKHRYGDLAGLNL